MLSLTKYFVADNKFEAIDSETGTIEKVTMERLVQGTVAGYIFHDESFNIKMSTRKADIDGGSLIINIADCGNLEVIDEDGCCSSSNISLAFAAPGDNLRCFMFMNDTFSAEAVVERVISSLSKDDSK